MVVVGAGPAGASTARSLAARGASVILLDRARFPRDKPCGGGITARAARLVPFPLDPVVEDRVDRIDFRLGYRTGFSRRADRPLILMTQRLRLDSLLVERAVEAGVELREGVKASRIERDGVGVVVRTDAGDVRARLAIGADGANGIAVRAVEHPAARTYCIALEATIPYERGGRDRYRSRAVLELGVVAGGYGWIFPKEDHVNVGVAGWEREAPMLRRHLVRLLAAHGLSAESLVRPRAHRLPLRAPQAPLAGNGVLLVGDAAGVVDPLSGDGIFEALASAEEAAATAAGFLSGSASVDEYPARLLARLSPLSASSWEWKTAYDRFPRLSFAITRLPPAWRVIQQLLRGDLVDPARSRGPDRLPTRLLELLGRAAGAPGAAYRRESAEGARQDVHASVRGKDA